MAPMRHNLSRRALLGAGVVAPAFLADCASPLALSLSKGTPSLSVREETSGLGQGPERVVGAPSLRAGWNRALAAWRRAEAKLAAFRAAIRHLPPERRAFPASQALDDRFDDLECARLERLRRLLRAPAPDLPALALKINLIVVDQGWELTGAESFFAALKADARRLCHDD